MRKQNLIVINLDRLIVVDASTKADIQRLASKELENKLMDNPHTVFMDNAAYLSLFELIAEQPQEAIKLLEKAAKYQCFGGDFTEQRARECFEKAMKCERVFVEEAKQKLFNRFLEERISGPDLHWWITCELLAVVKDDYSESLNLFQKCYEQIAKNNKKQNSIGDLLVWDEKCEETQIIIQALKTKNFYGKAMLNDSLVLKSNPLDLYKENSSDFIRYFSELEDVKEKKAILRLLLDCDYENKEIIDWLNKNHFELIRDAALEHCNPAVDKSYLKHFGAAFIPEEEVIQVPEEHLENYVALSKYLMKLEGASLNNIGLIKPRNVSNPRYKAVIIPRKGDANWKEGAYIIKNLPWYFDASKNYQIYKTEKCYTDEELACRTIREGGIIRYTPQNLDFQFLVSTENNSISKNNFLKKIINKFK